MKQNKVIAITGGIGSGKSTVIELIKEQGFKVISADEVYKELVKDPLFTRKVYEGLGLEYNGKPFDSKYISSIVFSDKSKLQLLNSITHPLVMEKMFSLSTDGVVFHEVPLLLESKLEGYYNNIIVVKRNIESRIQSVIKRSNLSREDVVKRINNQVDYENLDYSKFIVIENNSTINSLKERVNDVIKGVCD